MTPERWQQIKSVLDDALERAPAERAAFVAAACGGDGELRSEVESLLASEEEIGDFIEEPICHLRSAAPEALSTGQEVGPYRIVREIGRGGMGAVYLAVRADVDFEQRFALKVIRRGMDTEEIVRRFRAERRIVARLDHPNIARLLDGGTTEDGRPYFVMEHVDGRPIDVYCAAEGLAVPARLALFRTVCAAVHFAHQNLVVHRDLKPGNILVTAEGVPKLLDFGIAKILDPERPDAAETALGLRPMTPEVASPEQVRGDPVTTASDVYSLGVLLYLLLTGVSPYAGKKADPEALARAIREEEPVRPSRAAGAVSVAADLDNIVAMAMRKDPQRRYSSVSQLAEDVGFYLEGRPVLARKDSLGYRARKFVGRHKVGAGLATAALLLVLGFSATVTLLWRRAVRERERAETVSRFLEDLFAIPDPSQSKGEKITAREVLDRGTTKISRDLRGQPEVEAALLGTMGQVYRNLGLYKQARDLLDDSLAIRRRTLGNGNLLVAESLQDLAAVRRELGDNAAAEPLLREALAIQEKRGAVDTPEHAKALNDLAALLQAKGDYDGAERLYQESLALKRKILGAEHVDVARGLNNLARLRQERGDLAAAERYYRESLAMRRRLLGEADPEVATSLGNLAAVLEDRGDLAGAESLDREALAMRRKLYGDHHPRVARSLNNLASVLKARGHVAAAEPLYREALAIADEALGPKHPERAIYLRHLAAVLTAGEKAGEAEPLAREAVAILRQSSPGSWRLADAESVLGGCLAAQGRFAEAEPLLLQSYETLRKDKGDGAKSAPEARQRIVDLYQAWGKPASAARTATY